MVSYLSMVNFTLTCAFKKEKKIRQPEIFITWSHSLNSISSISQNTMPFSRLFYGSKKTQHITVAIEHCDFFNADVNKNITLSLTKQVMY